MRHLPTAIVTLTALVAAVMLAWAVWLIATPDADGGRRPAGLFLLAFTIVFAGVAWFLARPVRRR